MLAAGGCERLLTEDLNDGQLIGSVRVENPFGALRGTPDAM
jgi:predicted nucleic acid-binding protein